MKQYALKIFAFMLLPTYSESPHYVQYMPQASIHLCVCFVCYSVHFQLLWMVPNHRCGLYYNGLCENLLKILQDFINFNKYLWHAKCQKTFFIAINLPLNNYYQYTFGFTCNGHLIFHCTSLTDMKHLQSDLIKLSWQWNCHELTASMPLYKNQYNAYMW